LLALIKQFSNYNEEQLTALLKSEKAEERFAASYVVGENKAPLPREVITLLGDSSIEVQQVSRRSLILLACHAAGPRKSCTQLTQQVNSLLKLGPVPTKNKQLIARASARWNSWWDHNDPRLLKLTGVEQASGDKGEATQGVNPQLPKQQPEIAKGSAAVLTPEDAARAKLSLAKMLARDGLLGKAKFRYEQILRDYPQTKAASEARELLDKIKE
jgi:hypothetical protein